MNAQDDIDRVLGGEEPPFSETPDSALPEDYRRAAQMLYRLRRVRARRSETEALYDAMIEELEQSREAALTSLRSTEQWLEQALALWHHARRNEDETLKTIALPTGRLESSDAQDKWEYLDEAGFLKWAHENKVESAVRPAKPGAETIDRDEARKALDGKVVVRDGVVIYSDTGETIPGLRITPGGVLALGRFYKART